MNGTDDVTDDVTLSELEVDAITELVNLGVSRAAANLARMVHEEVILNVPKVVLMNRREAIEALSARESKSLVAVHQTFEGEITGRALLIFPEEKSLELVRAVVGSDLPLEEIIELEQEALAETGNIILNSCLATIANSLESNLKISLPEVLRGESSNFFNVEPPSAARTVMFIYINFAMQKRDINGYIAMMMDMPSLTALQTLLRALIRRTSSASHA
jgi:chemotaxis protein CheC